MNGSRSTPASLLLAQSRTIRPSSFEPEEDPGVARYCPAPLKVAICMTQSPDWGAVAL